MLHVNVCFPARFLPKHLTGLLTTPTPEGAAACPPRSPEEALADELQEKFPLVVFSCLQLSSKLSLHRHVGSVTGNFRHTCQQPASRNYRHIVLKILSR